MNRRALSCIVCCVCIVVRLCCIRFCVSWSDRCAVDDCLSVVSLCIVSCRRRLSLRICAIDCCIVPSSLLRVIWLCCVDDCADRMYDQFIVRVSLCCRCCWLLWSVLSTVTVCCVVCIVELWLLLIVIARVWLYDVDDCVWSLLPLPVPEPLCLTVVYRVWSIMTVIVCWLYQCDCCDDVFDCDCVDCEPVIVSDDRRYQCRRCALRWLLRDVVLCCVSLWLLPLIVSRIVVWLLRCQLCDCWFMYLYRREQWSVIDDQRPVMIVTQCLSWWSWTVSVVLKVDHRQSWPGHLYSESEWFVYLYILNTPTLLLTTI